MTSGALWRRWPVPALLAGLALAGCAPTPAVGESSDQVGPVPVIHMTDLFRPHNDPDDHWDLVTLYALVHRGRLRLEGIVIDYPPEHPKGYTPDLAAVARLNRLTGLTVPVAVGSAPGDRTPPAGRQGVRLLLDVLRRSPRPVVVHVAGHCRDLALAGRVAPGLFARKCAGIYLNAGTGAPVKRPGDNLEYNVKLDPESYTRVFDMPCPIYWMPCFEHQGPNRPRKVKEYRTYYRFRQGDILPHLSVGLRDFFAALFQGHADQCWLCPKPVAEVARVLSEQGKVFRPMWCTAGFLHSAGYGVNGRGELVDLWDGQHVAHGPSDAVFSFLPIRITSNTGGRTQWVRTEDRTNRFIFRIDRPRRYAKAVTLALTSLLATLP